MDQLKLQEQLVMEQWGVRKTMAEHCVQYLELEQSANEVSGEQTWQFSSFRQCGRWYS